MMNKIERIWIVRYSMKKKLILAWILAFLLAFTGCVPGFDDLVDLFRDVEVVAEDFTKAPATDVPATGKPIPTANDVYTTAPPSAIAHTDLHFSDIAFEQPDVQSAIDSANDLLQQLEQGVVGGTEAQAALDELIAFSNSASSMASVAYVLYCKDVTNEAMQDTYDKLSVDLNELSCLLVDIALYLSNDPALSDEYDAETVEKLETADEMNDLSVQDLVEEDRALTSEYDTLQVTFTTTYNGVVYTYDDVMGSDLPEDSATAIWDQFMTEYNQAAGEIYLKMINVRNEMAQKLGYSDYAVYGYACYGRDYTVDDAAAIAAAVKENLVPLFRSAYYSYAIAYYYSLSNATYNQTSTMENVHTVVTSILPELEAPWQYMIEHEMYDFDTSDKKMEGSYTTYFETYGAPFLYTSWDDSASMPSTLIHEFGHYSNYYLNYGDDWLTGDSLDMAEIDSQGLEMLSQAYYDTLFGSYADDAQIYNLFNAMYSIVTGCMEDELQRYAYTTEGVKLSMLNAKYESLCKEYGFDTLGYEGTYWTLIPHTFQSPMYYISYATSMIGAMQIFDLSQTDYAAAVLAYKNILYRPKDAAFRETLQAVGLSDPMDPQTIRDIAASLKTVLTKLDAQ